MQLGTYGMACPLLCAALVGCAATPEAAPRWTEHARGEAAELEARLAAQAPVPAGDVRVQLAFGRGADLDLYVTGPLEETVYYANTPTRVGGELEEDRRCDLEGEHVETITFPSAREGRYRVGVDYPEACGGGDGPVPFVVRIDTTGSPAGGRTQRGLARLRVFDPVVLEFDHVKETP